MSERLCLALNLPGNGLSQYQNFNFNSFCEFNGVVLGASDDGIFQIDSTTGTDAGADIDAWMKLPITDMGISNRKTLRTMHLGYEADGDLIVTLSADDGEVRDFTLASTLGGNRQQGGKVFIPRDIYGRYWSVKVANVDGADFSLDAIDTNVIIHNRR